MTFTGHNLQVHQTASPQSGIQAFALPERSATALATMLEKAPKSFKDVPVQITKRLPRIPIVEGLFPASDGLVDLDYHILQGSVDPKQSAFKILDA